MKKSILVSVSGRRASIGLLCFLLAAVTRGAGAAEIESLSWSVGTSTPTLEIMMEGEAAYSVEPRENGQWLRLSFPGTKLGAHAADLDGQQYVKGVYPSMGPDGTTALVDVVLEQPGQVRIEKTQFGFAASIESAKVAQAKATAPARKQTPPPPSASTVAPAVGASTPPARPIQQPATERPPPATTTEAPNEIKDIVYTKLPGERVQIVMRMARRPTEPSAFSITNPARVALDFPATRVTMANKNVTVREGAVSSVAAIESDGRTRVVLNLVKLVGYTAAVDGDNYVVTLNAPGATIAGTDQPKTTHFASTRQQGTFR